MKNKRFLQNKRRPYSERQVNKREIRQRFLIVCEGKKTEPNYFGKFRGPFVILNIHGAGCNTLSLVEEAVEWAMEDEYDQIWCVFDRDSFSADIFNRALQLAERKGFHVAYSNEAFELWYILHLEYLTSALTRKDYIKKLSKLLGHPYQKDSETIFDELENYQDTAIKNARKLLQSHSSYNPYDNTPSTTVHLLVEQLNKFKAT